MNSNWLKENVFFVFFIFLALFLRFLPINEFQFSHDELSALSRTVYSDLPDTIIYGVQYTDTHPILIQVFLFFWIKLFGYSEIAIKLPFLICGILTTVFAYRFMHKWYGKQAALFSQMFFTSSFIFILYSSYARMYAPGILISVLLINYLFNILFEKKISTKDYFWFALFCLLSALNNHLNALFAFTAAFMALFYIEKSRLRNFILTCLLIVLFYIPHLPITLTQFQIGGLGVQDNGWLPPPKSTALFDFLQVLFGTGLVGIINVFIVLLIILFSILIYRKIDKKQWILLFLFFINYSIIHLYSIYKSPLLQYSVLLFSGTSLVFFVSSFIKDMSKFIFYPVLIFIPISMIYQGIVNKQELSEVHHQSFEEMTGETFRQMSLHGDNNVTGVFGAERFFVVLYELKINKKLKYVLASDSIFSSPEKTRAYFSSLSQKYIVLGDVDPLTVEMAREFYPEIISHQQSFFYSLIVLGKSHPEHHQWSKNEILKTYEMLSLVNQDSFHLETNLKFENDGYPLDSLTGEFPWAIKGKFSNFNPKEGQWLLCDLQFETNTVSTVGEDLLCFSVNSDDKSFEHFTASKISDYIIKKGINHLYLQVFCGAGIEEWNEKGNMACFIWKKDKTNYKIKNLKIYQLDYNPDKWRLWN